MKAKKKTQPKTKKAHKFTLRLSETLFKKIAEYAISQKSSVNRIIEITMDARFPPEQ